MKDRKHIDLCVELDEERLQGQYPVPEMKSVYFPRKPYQQQINIVKTIHKALESNQNALIDSPTGTGKTLALLIGALSYFSQNSKNAKVIYLTRTHSQINQIVSELEKVCYKFKVSIITSRESMCIHSDLRYFKGRDLDRQCDKLCSNGGCKYREPRQQYELPLNDMRGLKDLGLKKGFCPYFQQRRTEPVSNIVIMPYNYLMDLDLLSNIKVDIENSVIIIDQAHNIDNNAQDGCTIEINGQLLWNAIKSLELKNIIKSRRVTAKAEIDIFKGPLNTLFQNLLMQQSYQFNSFEMMLDRVAELTADSQRQYFPTGLTLKNIQDYLDVGKNLLKSLQVTEKLEQYIGTLQKLYQMALLQNYDNFSLYIEKNEEGVGLHASCLSASVIFKQIQKLQPRSIVLASGTMQPLGYWPQELGVEFKCPLQNPSFITPSHIHSCVFSNYGTGPAFDFTYIRRSNPQQLDRLRDLINLIGRLTPNGVVVAFNSYDLLAKFMFGQSKLSKPVFLQTKDCNVEDIMTKYSQKTKQVAGAFLFTIMRGKFSEGIDFKDEMCRALIVVGVPFPPVSKKVSDKRRQIDSMEEQAISSNEWYALQTMRAVNQALGRAVRHMNDYGSVFLIDNRYNDQELRNLLPKWFSTCTRPRFVIEQYKAFFERNKQGEITKPIKVYSPEKRTFMKKKLLLSGEKTTSFVSAKSFERECSEVSQTRKQLKSSVTEDQSVKDFAETSLNSLCK